MQKDQEENHKIQVVIRNCDGRFVAKIYIMTIHEFVHRAAPCRFITVWLFLNLP